MKRESYRDFVIEAGRLQLQNNLGWSSLLSIEKHDKDRVTVKEVPVKGVFETEEEAIESGLVNGRKVIDSGFLI